MCHIMGGCGKKPMLAIDVNTSNFLMHLGRYHLKQYAELIEAQEKTAIVIYTTIFSKVPYRLKNLCTAYL